MTKIAAIQFKPPKKSVSEAVDKLLLLIDEAGKADVDLIVCPEMATTGYLWESAEELLPFAEEAEGTSFSRLAAAAKNYQSWIVCGFAELDPSSTNLYNSAWIISPSGRLVCCYRKILLYDSDYSWSRSGNQRFLIETSFGMMFPAICMDLNDDHLLQVIWKEQPKIFAFCTNWLEEGSDVLSYWRQRLWGYQGIFVAANTWGWEKDIQFSGHSAILGENGVLLAQAKKEGDEVILAVV